MRLQAGEAEARTAAKIEALEADGPVAGRVDSREEAQARLMRKQKGRADRAEAEPYDPGYEAGYQAGF